MGVGILESGKGPAALGLTSTGARSAVPPRFVLETRIGDAYGRFGKLIPPRGARRAEAVEPQRVRSGVPNEQSCGKEGREHGRRVSGDRVMRTGQPTCQARCQRARQLRRQRAIRQGKETATVKCQQNRSRRADSWVPRSLGTSGTCSLGAEWAHGGEEGAFLWLQDRPPVVYWPWPGGLEGNTGSRADVPGGKPCCPSHLSITKDTT